MTQSDAAHERSDAVINVIAPLRAVLAKFVGAESFTSLLQRSVVLAREEAPGLANLSVDADGRMHRSDTLSAGAPAADEHAHLEAAAAVISNLLRLLSIFIGMPLTVRLIRHAWPSLTLDPFESRSGAET